VAELATPEESSETDVWTTAPDALVITVVTVPLACVVTVCVYPGGDIEVTTTLSTASSVAEEELGQQVAGLVH
jgi:hypothetical protein